MVNPSDAMKVPPHDAEAEKSVLGAILIDSSAINLIAEFLKPEHFYLAEHQAIFSSMLVLFEKQQPVDLVTLADQLKLDGILKKIGQESAVPVSKLTIKKEELEEEMKVVVMEISS